MKSSNNEDDDGWEDEAMVVDDVVDTRPDGHEEVVTGSQLDIKEVIEGEEI